MKWLIVVIFAMGPGDLADNGRDLYIFTDPTYEEKHICEASITDPQYIPVLVEKLLHEYGKPKKIESVVCVEEQELKNALEGKRSV